MRKRIWLGLLGLFFVIGIVFVSNVEAAVYKTVSDRWSSTGDNAHKVSGNVGIGTNTPSTKLHVVGTVTATNFVGSGGGITGLTAASGIQWSLIGDNLSAIVGTATVSIGTTTAGSQLFVNGTSTIAGNIVIGTSTSIGGTNWGITMFDEVGNPWCFKIQSTGTSTTTSGACP